MTSIICTISPHKEHLQMSISTLEFARRAKDIKNKAKVNEVVKDYDAIKKLQSVRYLNFITIFTANQEP